MSERLTEFKRHELSVCEQEECSRQAEAHGLERSMEPGSDLCACCGLREGHYLYVGDNERDRQLVKFAGSVKGGTITSPAKHNR